MRHQEALMNELCNVKFIMKCVVCGNWVTVRIYVVVEHTTTYGATSTSSCCPYTCTRHTTHSAIYVLCWPVTVFMWMRVSAQLRISELLFLLMLSDTRPQLQLSFQYIQMLDVTYTCMHAHGFEKLPFCVCITGYSNSLSFISLF
jgi:hypothetical protein